MKHSNFILAFFVISLSVFCAEAQIPNYSTIQIVYNGPGDGSPDASFMRFAEDTTAILAGRTLVQSSTSTRYQASLFKTATGTLTTFDLGTGSSSFSEIDTGSTGNNPGAVLWFNQAPHYVSSAGIVPMLPPYPTAPVLQGANIIYDIMPISTPVGHPIRVVAIGAYTPLSGGSQRPYIHFGSPSLSFDLLEHIGSPTGSSSLGVFLTRINDSGLLAGYAYDPITAPGITVPVVFDLQSRILTELAMPSSLPSQVYGIPIQDISKTRGDVVGSSSGTQLNPGQGHCMVWRRVNGVYQLPMIPSFPAGTFSRCNHINDAGLVSGTFWTSPLNAITSFIWDLNSGQILEMNYQYIQQNMPLPQQVLAGVPFSTQLRVLDIGEDNSLILSFDSIYFFNQVIAIYR